MSTQFKLGNIEFIQGICNPSTLEDGRGGLFTFLPVDGDKIVEFNFVYYNANKIRGNHYHPEFNEYILIVEGSGAILTKDSDDNTILRHICVGDCMRIPQDTPHAIHALTDLKLVSFLTKNWDDCNHPIIHDHVVEQDDEYRKYAEKAGFTFSAEEIREKNK